MAAFISNIGSDLFALDFLNTQNAEIPPVQAINDVLVIFEISYCMFVSGH